MGLFHCPVGSPYYDDEACIDCRLCLARNGEEAAAASARVRDYLRAEALKRKGAGRKIAVCGKGGTGKTTAVALLAHAFLGMGFSVLVLDLDESNPGLYQILGFPNQPRPLLGPETTPSFPSAGKISLAEVPSAFLLQKQNLYFLMAGKITDSFQGCACLQAERAREFVENLELKEKEILLIDTEAGVESFGRGVESHVDTVVIVAEPSAESLEVAEKIASMAEGIGVRTIWGVANKIGDGMARKKMMDELDRRKIDLLGFFPQDRGLLESSLEGSPPPLDCTLREKADEMARRLASENSHP